MRWRAALLLFVAACNRDCRSACEKRGGRDARINCRTEMNIMPMPQMDGSVLPMVQYDRVCDEVCVVPAPDAR